MTRSKTRSTEQSTSPFTEGTQMEGPAVDFRCQTCSGDGEIDGEPVCAGALGTYSCGCQGRMCGFRAEECPDCDGKGVTFCEWCADEPATEVGPERELICRGCKQGYEEPAGADAEPSDPCDTDSYREMAEFYAQRRAPGSVPTW